MGNPPAQFVIQCHQTPRGTHWDLMLQKGQTLKTWQMPCAPEAIGDASVPLDKIHDHPLRFLTHQGPVQNNTAQVHIADKGTYEAIAESENEILVLFRGTSLKGRFVLHRSTPPNRWILTPDKCQ